jgi:hypothetical protein
MAPHALVPGGGGQCSLGPWWPLTALSESLSHSGNQRTGPIGPSGVGSMRFATLAVLWALQLEVPDCGPLCCSVADLADSGCCSNPLFVLRPGLCAQATPRTHHTLMSVWLMPLRQTRVSACCRPRTGARECSVQCAVGSGQWAVKGQGEGRDDDPQATSFGLRLLSPLVVPLPRVSCHRHDGHDGSHTQRFS